MTAKRGIPDRPQDFSGIVGRHWKSATAYVQASRQPCIRIQQEEVESIGENRNLVALGPGELHHIDRDRIWVLGVIVCPGDSVVEVTEWVRMNRLDPGRVWFFLHRSTDMAVLEPWARAGFRTDQADIVEDWGDLHSVFGLYLSDLIYEAKGPPHARTWTPGRRPK
jgi:hypothetical protein